MNLVVLEDIKMAQCDKIVLDKDQVALSEAKEETPLDKQET